MGYIVKRRQITADGGHCDPGGFVFNSRFFEYFDTSSWALFHVALGVAPNDLAGAFDIMGIPLVDARAKFSSSS